MNLIDEDKLADRMFPRMDSGDLTKAYRTGWNEAIHSIPQMPNSSSSHG